jgi:hypothetical protein
METLFSVSSTSRITNNSCIGLSVTFISNSLYCNATNGKAILAANVNQKFIGIYNFLALIDGSGPC